jgi:phage head maturation protease
MPGAFAKSLREHGPLILFQHKTDDAPVGVCVDAREDKRGLWVKAELPKDDVFVAPKLLVKNDMARCLAEITRLIAMKYR